MEAGMVLVSDELNRLQPCSNIDLLWMEDGNSVHVIEVLVTLLFGWTLKLNAIDCSSPLLICVYATKTIPL